MIETDQREVLGINAFFLYRLVIYRDKISSKLKILNNRVFVYILKKEEEIIYVGFSKSLYFRLIQHKAYIDFDSIKLIEMEDEKVARSEEKFLIKQYRPRFNRQYL